MAELTPEQRAAKRERDRRYYQSHKGIANRLRKEGRYGTRNPMSTIGTQPHHVSAGMPDAEAIFVARQAGQVQPNPDRVYAPTATINPDDPRTKAASYYSQTQTVVIEWGDNGVPYAYYDVTPQEWDAFTQAESPGRYINAVLNAKNYGPIGPRLANGERKTNY